MARSLGIPADSYTVDRTGNFATVGFDASTYQDQWGLQEDVYYSTSVEEEGYGSENEENTPDEEVSDQDTYVLDD